MTLDNSRLASERMWYDKTPAKIPGPYDDTLGGGAGEYNDPTSLRSAVVGDGFEQDIWAIMVVMRTYQNYWAEGQFDPPLDFNTYIWAASMIQTHDLGIWGVAESRVVSGQFWVQDELNHMAFAATFWGDDLATLSLEVDTEWSVIYELKPVKEGEEWTVGHFFRAPPEAEMVQVKETKEEVLA